MDAIKKLTRISAWFTLFVDTFMLIGISPSLFGLKTHAVIGHGQARITSETSDGTALILLLVIWSGILAGGLLLHTNSEDSKKIRSERILKKLRPHEPLT